jgi:hypothetical protein
MRLLLGSDLGVNDLGEFFYAWLALVVEQGVVVDKLAIEEESRGA